MHQAQTHLMMMMMMMNDKCIQKPKESEDVFAEELQILVRKTIARKPEFHLKVNRL